MKRITFTLSLLFIFFTSIAIGQDSKFQAFPDFEINIAPQIPLICNGEPTSVKCNEKFESYEWEGVGFDFQAFGDNVELTTIGQYTLTVKGEINGVFYFKILNFFTAAEDSNNNGICDRYDCLPKNPFAAEGLACNDGNPCTVNDTFDQDCRCIGKQISDCKEPPEAYSPYSRSELQSRLEDTFNYVKNYIPKEGANANLFEQLSTIPYAHKLLDADVKHAIDCLFPAEKYIILKDILDSRYISNKLGNNLKSLTPRNVIAWSALLSTPGEFRLDTLVHQKVYRYMTDIGKKPSEIIKEIVNTPKGYKWWYDYVLGRKYWTPFLDNIDSIKSFAAEIIAFNKQTEGRGNILSGSPSSAINTALYYDDILEQGASIFKTIVKNHMFYDGNKRTAAATIKSFMLKAGIPINKSDKKLFKLAKKVAKDEVVEVSDIANKLIK